MEPEQIAKATAIVISILLSSIIIGNYFLSDKTVDKYGWSPKEIIQVTVNKLQTDSQYQWDILETDIINVVKTGDNSYRLTGQSLMYSFLIDVEVSYNNNLDIKYTEIKARD